MDGMLAGKVVISAGFGCWFLLNVFNHLVDFNGSLQAVAGFMRMSSLDEPPPIPSPLKRRAIDNPTIHSLALVVITIIHGALAAIFVGATVFLLGGQTEAGSQWAASGFALSAALWFLFLIAGSWFGYWIRLDGLQRTHLALLATSMLGLIYMTG